MDRIQEDIQNLVNMNQPSQARKNPGAIQPMEEESVEQPVKPPGFFLIVFLCLCFFAYF